MLIILGLMLLPILVIAFAVAGAVAGAVALFVVVVVAACYGLEKLDQRKQRSQQPC